MHRNSYSVSNKEIDVVPDMWGGRDMFHMRRRRTCSINRNEKRLKNEKWIHYLNSRNQLRCRNPFVVCVSAVSVVQRSKHKCRVLMLLIYTLHHSSRPNWSTAIRRHLNNFNQNIQSSLVIETDFNACSRMHQKHILNTYGILFDTFGVCNRHDCHRQADDEGDVK